MKTRMINFLLALSVTSVCNANCIVEPLYPNSVVSNEIDFIRKEDPSVFERIEFLGRDRREIPGSETGELFDNSAFVFRVIFDDTELEILAHSSFDTKENAQQYAQELGDPLGKLPVFMREKLSHVALNTGDKTAFAEHLGHFFVMYSENIDTRISNHDLEETVFHESVHATLDYTVLEDERWVLAQQEDGCFVTRYAMERPNKEDLAESALFIYTMNKHPGRLSDRIERWLVEHVPSRVSYLSSELFAE